MATKHPSATTPRDTVTHLWRSLSLPDSSLGALDLPEGDENVLNSSFKVAHLAQSTIATTALTAAAIYALRSSLPTPRTTVELPHAAAAFVSERLISIDGHPAPPEWGVIGGLNPTTDGYVRVHDSFAHHRTRIVQLLGCEERREDVTRAIASWTKVELEEAALGAGAVVYALRTEEEFDALHVESSTFPILLKPSPAPAPSLSRSPPSAAAAAAAATPAQCPHFLTAPSAPDKPLSGLRVLDLSRVIAAPVAGRALAALGADVLWITSPRLPTLPGLDADMTRGKRAAHLDLEDPADAERLRQLVRDADVFIQSYRPGALQSRGFGSEEVRRLNPGIIYASLSAWGPGRWSTRRGFDSLVQTASGLNASEAMASGEGYLLATGILAALYKKLEYKTDKEGGYGVIVSLASTMTFLKSLGRRDFDSTLSAPSLENADAYLETTPSEVGVLRGVSFPARIDGVCCALERAPDEEDVAEWL